MMYHLRRPSAADLASLALRQSSEPVSYPEVGISLTTADQPGYHRLRARRALGTDEALFRASRHAIEGWAGHHFVGATLEPPQPQLESGVTVVLALRVWPVWVTAACKVVTVVEETHRFGFAYGSLPNHPVRGEEAFLVVRDPTSGEVHLEISACSRPRTRLARLSGPFGRWFQRRTAEKYLDGFEAAARAGA